VRYHPHAGPQRPAFFFAQKADKPLSKKKLSAYGVLDF
jgi:hypothetical protein